MELEFFIQTYLVIVQSLNSPFFPPHIWAEPGRAKEESRITSFARPGSAPIWGGKKGEFRDWTNLIRVTELLVYVNDLVIWYNLSPLANLLFIFIFIVIVQDDCSAKPNNAICEPVFSVLNIVICSINKS